MIQYLQIFFGKPTEKRKVLAGVMTFALLFSTLTFTETPTIFAAENAKENQVIILHTTDTHGYAAADSSSFGYAKMASVINQIRKENPNTLVFDSGDMYEGMPFANFEVGESVAPITDKINYDAMTTGNHDYSYGINTLKKLAGEAKVPILAANVTDKSGNLVFQDGLIKDYGVFQIGVFGLANENTPNITLPSATEGLIFHDEIDTAKKMVTKLKEQGADYIVAITHLGSVETENYASVNLAKSVTGLDLILDGHSHVINEGTKYGDTLLVASGYYTQDIGIVNLTFQGENLSNVTSKVVTPAQYKEVTPDPTIDKLVKEVEAKQATFFNKVVGNSKVFLNGEKASVRTKETNLGRLIAESYRIKSKSDIAFINGGGIRNSIEPGEMTLGDIYAVQPFGNYLVTKKITGAEVKEILEKSLSEKTGEFLHVSGLTVTFDSQKPAGNRITSIKMTDLSKTFDEKSTYLICTSNYVATNNAFPALKAAPELNQFGTDYEATAEYINNGGVQELEPGLVNTSTQEKPDIIRSSWSVPKGPAYEEPQKNKEELWLLPMRSILENDQYTVAYNHQSKVVTAKKEGVPNVTINLLSGDTTIKSETRNYEIRFSNGRVLMEQAFFETLLDCTVYDEIKDAQAIILY